MEIPLLESDVTHTNVHVHNSPFVIITHTYAFTYSKLRHAHTLIRRGR